MLEYSTIYSAALMGTFEEFLKKFNEEDQYYETARTDNLLYTALRNADKTARYEIANFLISKGADVKVVTEDGESLFFPLFSYIGEDIEKTTILCKRLLEKGADITVLDKKHRIACFWSLFGKEIIHIPEIELMSLYQLIFSQPGLPLLIENNWGMTVIDLARQSYRETAVKMMEDYLKKPKWRWYSKIFRK